MQLKVIVESNLSALARRCRAPPDESVCSSYAIYVEHELAKIRKDKEEKESLTSDLVRSLLK